MTVMDAQPLPPPLNSSRRGWPWTDFEPPRPPADVHPDAWPVITVVTPSFNQGAFLEETIRSILAQGYTRLEYIVLDGGSSDNSAEILAHYDGFIDHWESRPDAGQADAINRSFNMASGSVMGWLNSDDLYLPGALFTVGERFARAAELQLLYGEGWYLDEGSERVEPCRFVRRRFDYTYLVNRDPILQPAAFWRRELWTAVGPLNTDLHWVFDWEWFIRAFTVAQFDYLPEFLAGYRVQPAAKTRTGGLARQQEHGRVTRQYGSFWHPNHVVQQTRRLDGSMREATARWPAPLAWPLQGLAALPKAIAERLLHGMYMR